MDELTTEMLLNDENFKPARPRNLLIMSFNNKECRFFL